MKKSYTFLRPLALSGLLFSLIAGNAFAQRSETLKIEAESADALYNTYTYSSPISIGTITEANQKDPDDPDGGVVNSCWNTNFVIYKNVDFGSEATKIRIRKHAVRGYKVEYWIDQTPTPKYSAGGYNRRGGTKIGEYVFAESGTGVWTRWGTHETTLETPVSGVHDLYLVFANAGGTASNQNLAGYNWIEIDKSTTDITAVNNTQTDVSLLTDMTKNLDYQLNPTNAYIPQLTWSVAAGADVVSVDAKGAVTALKAGTATVKASSSLNNSIAATYTITVTDASKIGADMLKIQAEDADHLGNSYNWGNSDSDAIKVGEITNDPSDDSNVGVNSIWHSTFLQYKGVDFGSYTSSITLRKNHVRGFSAQYWIDCTISEDGKALTGGKKIGEYVSPKGKTSDWSVWENLDAAITGVSGVHDLYIVFYKNSLTDDNQNFAGLNWLQLDRHFILPTAISTTSATATMPVNDTKSFDITFEPQETYNKGITWSVAPNTIISIDENGVITALAEGTIRVTATSVADPTLSTTIDITVSGTVSIDEATAATRIYPNPMSDNLTIEADSPINSVQLWNTSGQAVISEKAGELTTKTISTTDLIEGIYFVKVTTEKGTEIQKVIKK